MLVDDLERKFEEILTYYSEKDGGRILHAAKDRYFQITGTVDHDTQDFEHKMKSFTEWFVLHYTPIRSGEKIYQMYAKEREIEEHLLNLFNKIIFSLFDPIGKNIRGQEVLLDCITQEKFVLSPHQDPFMIVKGELFSGRTIVMPTGCMVLKGIVPLPLEVRSMVEKQAIQVSKKAVDMTEDEFLLSLEGMRYRCMQYQHLDPTNVFKFS